MLLDGKRVVESYDDEGNPIYKQLILSKEDGWKGSFDKINPNALTQGRYSVEEDSDYFAPLIKENPGESEVQIQLKISYSKEYRPFGSTSNSVVSTERLSFDLDFGTVLIHLFVDGVEKEAQTFRVMQHPIFEEIKFIDTNFPLVFGKDNENPLILPLQNGKLNVEYYDQYDISNGQLNYNSISNEMNLVEPPYIFPE